MLKEKDNYQNQKKNTSFDETELKREVEQHTQDDLEITAAIAERLDKDMDKKAHEFIIDMFNLIFGRCEETD